MVKGIMGDQGLFMMGMVNVMGQELFKGMAIVARKGGGSRSANGRK